MAVSKNPAKKHFVSESENKINQVIQGGGSVSQSLSVQRRKRKVKAVSLRIPEDLAIQVDDILNQIGYISQNQWIVEAIDEKIQRYNELSDVE